MNKKYIKLNGNYITLTLEGIYNNYYLTDVVKEALEDKFYYTIIKTKTISKARHIYIRYIELVKLTDEEVKKLEDKLKEKGYNNYSKSFYTENLDINVLDIWQGGF